MQLSEIATKDVGENDLNPRTKYVMVRLDNRDKNFYKRGDRRQESLQNKVIYMTRLD